MRTDDEIEDGVIPDAAPIVLGGKSYPVQEPANARARVIRRAMAEYESKRVAASANDVESSELLETFLDDCIRIFSPDIEADWKHIQEQATDSERLDAIVKIRDAVSLPFTRLVQAATPAPNRATRRKTKPTRASHGAPSMTS